jgi:hypothetical protein
MISADKNNGVIAVGVARDASLNLPGQKYVQQTGVKLFHEGGEIVELRALNGSARVCLLFTDPDELMERAQALSSAGYNCYHTINPISPTLGAPSAKDDDILRIRWIPYDIDPDRKAPDGTKLKGNHASTEAEKSGSFEIAGRVTAFWKTLGVEPALVDHGNGYCVLVPTEMEKIDAGLVADILKLHAREYDTLAAHIDVSVGNPSRILRIPGTVNRKGENTPDRPHRMSRIIEAGNRDQIVRAEDLRRLLPPPAKETPAKRGIIVTQGIGPEWVEDFLEHSDIEHSGRKKYRDGHKWVLKTILDQDYCPNQSNHNSGNGPSTQAVFIDGRGKLGFQCSHSHCIDIHWRQFRDFHERRNQEEGRGRFREEWSDTEKEVLVISGAALNETVLKAEALLTRKHELRYFRRGSDLVKPVQHNKKDITGLGRDKESVVVQPASQHTIIRDVSLHASCIDGRGSATSFSANFAAHLLDRVRCEPTDYRILEMATTSPVLLPDGSVLDRPGHRCGVLFYGGGDYPSVPAHPTKDDAIRALRQFDDLYRNFPFVREEGEEWWQTTGYAALLAGILSLVARAAVPTVPMVTANATTRGSGKTKSIEAAVIAALGHKPTVVSFHNEEEFAKSLVPLLREGDRATLIDNVSIPLSGDMLCSVLTSEEHRARILGQSEQVRLINRSVFFATGNNLAIQGDLTRRAVQIQLDPDCEHPERRRFDFDPVLRAAELHPRLCVAAITALRGYWVAGRPDVLDRPALGSFEAWDRLICGCLVWAGFADPVRSQGAVEESDPEREANLELLTTWYDTLADPISVGRIGARQMDPVRELLTGGESWNARAVGKRLRGLQKRVIDGYKLQSRVLSGARLWYVTRNGKRNPDLPKTSSTTEVGF